MTGCLVAILHSEPLGGGTRTLNRVDLARRILGQSTYRVANIFPRPIKGTNELGELLEESDTWNAGRQDILTALAGNDVRHVLLGYGVNVPSGPQRSAFRAQLSWLSEELASRPHQLWGFGGRPTHPSRWQRVAHRHDPGSALVEVAGEVLVEMSAGQIS